MSTDTADAAQVFDGRDRREGQTGAGKAVGATGRFLDDRLGGASAFRILINKVFPDHWSFMIGEIALYSFIILLLTGTYLTMFFADSTTQVLYHGSYLPLQGVPVSAAYDSTLRISFDVRGGLLIRQIHHWAALLFVAAMVVHAARIFFTGAYRKPRELNWVIGVILIMLGLLEGFCGYSLPDDLLSGTGLRIMYSVLLSIPVAGTWVAYLIFGGAYPGTDIINRLYVIHILLVPGILLALIGAHLGLLFHQKHTQFPGPGKEETNVVGERVFPVYAAKAQGYFFIVFGVLALLGGLAQINPVWLYGPYNPGNVSAGSQPDWYIGFIEGSVRIMPNWEWRGWGYDIPFMLLIPGLVIPGIYLTGMLLYPFLEQKVTGDRAYHNLLQRPREAPNRTALGVMSLVSYGVLLLSGGNDVLGYTFHISLNALTWAGRYAWIFAPPVAFFVTKRICLGLLRRDEEAASHGYETGIVRRLPSGEYIEVHAPVPPRPRPILAPVETTTFGQLALTSGHGHLVPGNGDGAASEDDDVNGNGARRGFFGLKSRV
ncbi:MAG TPA: cytochrome bc complex cytochrome b subunit [Mycobacteriales bacterium]